MDDGTTALEALLKAMLGGMRDARVARALGARWPEGAVEHEPDHVHIERGGLADGLLAALDVQFLPRVRERLGEEAEEFGEVPPEFADSAEAAFTWVLLLSFRTPLNVLLLAPAPSASIVSQLSMSPPMNTLPSP